MVDTMIAHNNIIDTISKEKLDEIIDLRVNKKLSYPKIAKEMNMSNQVVFDIIKKHLGLGTHRGFNNGRT